MMPRVRASEGHAVWQVEVSKVVDMGTGKEAQS